MPQTSILGGRGDNADAVEREVAISSSQYVSLHKRVRNLQVR